MFHVLLIIYSIPGKELNEFLWRCLGYTYDIEKQCVFEAATLLS